MRKVQKTETGEFKDIKDGIDVLCPYRKETCTDQCAAYVSTADADSGVSGTGQDGAYCQAGKFMIGMFLEVGTPVEEPIEEPIVE